MRISCMSLLLFFSLVILKSKSQKSNRSIILSDISIIHNRGRNCSKVLSDRNLKLLKRAGHDGIQQAYIAALLSSLAYLDWNSDSIDIPQQIDINYGACESVKVSDKSLSEFQNTSKFLVLMNNVKLIFQPAGLPFKRIKSIIYGIFQKIRMIADKLSKPVAKFKLLIKKFMRYIDKPVSRVRYNQNIITPRWFMSDWNDGLFHDVEVLIADSDGRLFIIFRGTDSVADVLTGGQTYVPARRMSYFKDHYEGSIHRGILNAYTRVNSGLITFLSNISYNRDSYDQIFENFFRDCQLAANISERKSREFYDIKSNSDNGVKIKAKCAMKSSKKLSNVLVETVISAINSRKEVFITGHSLGGALGTLLFLDIAINNYEKLHDRLQSVVSKNDTSMSRGAKSYKSKSGNSESYCPLCKLNLIVFGDPEVADTIFFSDIYRQHAHIRHFINNNYFRFVSVSKSPSCSEDVVTGSMAMANNLFGDIIMGNGGGFMGRAITRARLRQKAFKREKNDSINKVSDLLRDSISNDTEVTYQYSEDYDYLLQNNNHGYMSDPIYLNSGYADSALAAHSVVHFLQGLARILNDYNLFSCDRSYSKEKFHDVFRDVLRDELQTSVSSVENVEHTKFLSYIVATNLSLSVLKLLALWPAQNCLVFDGEGSYSGYGC